VIAALSYGRILFLDLALVLALIGFVATVAWARLIDGSENPESL
jgi:multicomponent Na+:H+ antiporter subunit F